MPRLPSACLLLVLLQSIPLALAREARLNNGLPAHRHEFRRGAPGNGSENIPAVTAVVTSYTTSIAGAASIVMETAAAGDSEATPYVLAAAASSVSQSANSSAITTSTSSAISSIITASSTANASMTINPDGGVLSIPYAQNTPIQSLLATRQECEALMDDQLPPANSIPSNFTFSGKVRTYYVAAEEIEWNYAPTGWDNWLGVPLARSPRAAGAGYGTLTGSIGGDGGYTWQKAAYRGYTDATFTEYSEQDPSNGLNGPLLRAEVNDMVQILFVNKLSKNYATMHSMGLYYGKQYEGSLYPNTTNGQTTAPQEQDAVPPGGCAVYKWIASDSQAPNPGQTSRLWSYHSYVNMPADINAGLMGPLIIYSSGQMNSTMAANRENVLNFASMSELGSFLAGDNAVKYGGFTNVTTDPVAELIGGHYNGNESYWVPQMTNLPTTTLTAAQGPTFYALNGYVFSNGHMFEMCRDDPVIWYIMAYGDYSHVFHMHGNNFQAGSGEPWKAALSLNAGEMFTLNMNAQLPGVWQVICHVNMHMAFGMEHNYVVYEDAEYGSTCPLTPLTAKLTGSA